MYNNVLKKKYNIQSLQITVAKLYIFLLPIRMISPFLFMQGVVSACANYFDFTLHLLGVFLLILGSKGILHVRKDKTSRLFHYFLGMVVFLNLSSLFMSIIMQSTYGNIGSENSFRATLIMGVYFLQYALIFFYNKEIFKLIKKEVILSILHKLTIALLILGWVQVFVMVVKGPFGKIYDALDIFNVFFDSNMPKLALTGSEGASAGSLISILVIPLLLSEICIKNKVKNNVIQIFLWLPVLYFTYSSTAYILFVIDLIIFSLVYIFQVKKSTKSLLVIVAISLIVLTFLAFPSTIKILPEEVGSKIEYLLLDKATDKNNGSTASRTVPIITNAGAFSEYPILGVGNGNQGYFYRKYFPSWAFNVPGSDVGVFYDRASEGIVNGALFIPSLISGYGIIGMFFIILYILKCLSLVKQNKKQLGGFYFMMVISWIAILVTGFQGEVFGKYYVWFMLSIPFMVQPENNSKDIKNIKALGITEEEQNEVIID